MERAFNRPQTLQRCMSGVFFFARMMPVMSVGQTEGATRAVLKGHVYLVRDGWF